MINNDDQFLPSSFVTCFDESRLAVYSQAIDVYASMIDPEHCLSIDTSGNWNVLNDPALLCFKRGDLTKFWRILESIEAASKV